MPPTEILAAAILAAIFAEGICLILSGLFEVLEEIVKGVCHAVRIFFTAPKQFYREFDESQTPYAYLDRSTQKDPTVLQVVGLYVMLIGFSVWALMWFIW